jgi:twinkle protein
MDITQIKIQLANRAEAVAAMLLPNGKRKGAEWCVGSVHGEEGDSLKVHLRGNKAGVWKEFAGGQDKGGDLLDLWCAVKGGTLPEALTWAREYLGIHEPQFTPPAKRQFRKPERTPQMVTPRPLSPVLEYLTKQRGLNSETIKALKLAEMPARSFGPHKSPAVALPFLSPANELLFLKYLGTERPEGKKLISAEADCQPCLFGWQALAPNARQVVICEGEINAASWLQYGAGALATPFGAGKGSKHDWVDFEWDNLQRFEVIFLNFDQDTPGREAVEALVERLGRHRCRVIPPMPDGHKDINDCLCAGVASDAIVRLLAQAKSCDPPELRPAESFVDEVKAEFNPGPESAGIVLPIPCLAGKFSIRLHELTIVTGYTGHGKTKFLSMVLLHLMRSGQRCLDASLEVRARKTLAGMTRQVTCKRKPDDSLIDRVFEWMTGKLWLYDHVGKVDPKKVFEVFDYARRRYGVQYFVLDSLMKCGLRNDDLDGQAEFLNNLANYCAAHPVHIFLVAHPRKDADDSGEPGTQSIKGAGAITDQAHNLIVYHRNKTKEKALEKLGQGESLTRDEEAAQHKADSYLTIEKQREGDGDYARAALSFDIESQQIRQQGEAFEPMVPYAKLGWQPVEYPRF